MAAVTAPAGRSLLGKMTLTFQARSRARSGRPSRAAVFLAGVREHVVTVAALAAADFGAFQVHVPHLGSAPGWVTLCASLLLLDFSVRS